MRLGWGDLVWPAADLGSGGSLGLIAVHVHWQEWDGEDEFEGCHWCFSALLDGDAFVGLSSGNWRWRASNACSAVLYFLGTRKGERPPLRYL